MKKVICKRDYDTETAKLVRKITRGSLGDPEGYEECLYVSDWGGYFLYVNGGSRSPYPQEDIKRISAKVAEAWLDENKE